MKRLFSLSVIACALFAASATAQTPAADEQNSLNREASHPSSHHSHHHKGHHHKAHHHKAATPPQ